MKKLLVLIICMFMTMIAGCSFTTDGANTSKENLTLKIGLMPDVDSIPFIIAQEKGFFKEEGINVELENFKSAMDRDSALQSGNLDGCVSDMLAIGFAKAGGFDVKMTSATNGNYCLIAGTNNTAQSIREMKGQDIAVSKNTIIEFILDQMLAENNMNEKDINKTVIPQIPTRLEMLQSGKLAAAVLPEPMGSIAVKKGSRMINSSEQMHMNPGIMVFTNDSLENKTKAIKAMYRAYNKAVNYINNTPKEEFIDMAVDKAGLPPEAKTDLILPKYMEASLPSKKDWYKSINWLNQKGLIHENYKYEDMVSDILENDSSK